MVHEERLATSRSFEQYSSPISMLLKARCGRFAFACTFVFPTKRFKFARIKSIDNEALLRQLVQSSQKKVPLFFTTDRLVQILDFGEVSTDRQVLSRVIRKVLSNSKHTLLCLCGHNVLERIYAYTILCMDLCIFIQQSLGIRQKSFNQPQAYSTNPFNFF